jgi:hypothetical protein
MKPRATLVATTSLGFSAGYPFASRVALTCASIQGDVREMLSEEHFASHPSDIDARIQIPRLS